MPSIRKRHRASDLTPSSSPQVSTDYAPQDAPQSECMSHFHHTRPGARMLFFLSTRSSTVPSSEPSTHRRSTGPREPYVPGVQQPHNKIHAARARPALQSHRIEQHAANGYDPCAPLNPYEATASNGAPLNAPKLIFAMLARSICPVGVKGHAWK